MSMLRSTIRLSVTLLLVVLAACDRNAAPEAVEEPPDPLRVVTFNVWQDNSDWDARFTMLIDTMRALSPDVICLQEVIEHSSLPNQAQALADSLGYEVEFVTADTAGSRRTGNAILSSAALSNVEVARLDTLGGAVAGFGTTTLGDETVDVYCTSLYPAPSDSGAVVRASQMEALTSFIDSTRASNTALLMGGFYAEPDDEALDPLRASFVDAFPDGLARPTTMNPYIGHPERWVDYVFFSLDAAVRPTTIRRLFAFPNADGLWASDHFAVMVEFAPI